ncbi:MAG: FolB domain-containing protein [Acidobacteria bacterium]|nr:MAG: FolB domain-containing protein [Acidobacteriota bacterium]
MDRISISGLMVDCIVGLYRRERRRPQPVRVDLVLEVDARRAAESDRLRDTIDYGKLCGDVRFLLESSRCLLLESAGEALARYALSLGHGRGRLPVEGVRVKLTKSRALGGAALPAVEIRRRRAQVAFEIERRPFGEVDVIYASRRCGIYRLRIAPGRSIPTHVHQRMDESELVQSSGLLLQGQPVPAGSARRWPKGFPHRYDNPTRRERAILCVDCPPFMPGDEILVDQPPAPLDDLPAAFYYDARADLEPEADGAAPS